MRFRISLRPERERFRLPYNYNYALASAIYSFLARGNDTFAQFLHQEGFYHQGKAFKLFTFSPLLSKRRKAIKDGLLIEGKLNWFISSPKEEFVSNLAHGILEQGFLLFLGERLIVEEVEVLNQPIFEDHASFKTLSPIVISTGVSRDRNLHKKYLSPEKQEFSRILEENLRRKYQACYGKEAPGEGLSLKLLRTPGSKLIDYKGIKIRGWFTHFIAQGNPDPIKIGYEAGFGENNSANFGMVEVI